MFIFTGSLFIEDSCRFNSDASHLSANPFHRPLNCNISSGPNNYICSRKIPETLKYTRRNDD